MKWHLLSWDLLLLVLLDSTINYGTRRSFLGDAWTANQPPRNNKAFKRRHRHCLHLARKPAALQFEDDFYNQWNDTEEDDDPLNNIQNRRELEQALGSLFAPIKKQSSATSEWDVESYDSLRLGLDNFQSQPNPELPMTDNSDDENTLTNSGEPDGLFLNADAYAESRNWLNADGSLDLPEDAIPSSLRSGTSLPNDDDQQSEANRFRTWSESLLSIPQYPDEPSARASQGSSNRGEKRNEAAKEQYTLEDLLQLQQQQSLASVSASSNSSASDALYKQVFEQEQGYLSQSQVFRESLGSDSDQAQKAAVEAAKLRRGANYRQRQERLLQQLETQMSELGSIYKQQTKQKKTAETKPEEQQQLCSKCGCILDPIEVQQSVARGKVPICRVCHADALVEASSSVGTTIRKLNLNVFQRPNATAKPIRTPPTSVSSSAASATAAAASYSSNSPRASATRPHLVSTSASKSTSGPIPPDVEDIPSDEALDMQHRSRTRLRLSTVTSTNDKLILHRSKMGTREGQRFNTKADDEAPATPINNLEDVDPQPAIENLSVGTETSTATISNGDMSNQLSKDAEIAPQTAKRASQQQEVVVLKSPKKLAFSQENVMKEQEQESMKRKQRRVATSKKPVAPTSAAKTAAPSKPIVSEVTNKGQKRYPKREDKSPQISSVNGSSATVPQLQPRIFPAETLSMPPAVHVSTLIPLHKEKLKASPEISSAASVPKEELRSPTVDESTANNPANQNVPGPPPADMDYEAQAQESLQSVQAILQQLESYKSNG